MNGSQQNCSQLKARMRKTLRQRRLIINQQRRNEAEETLKQKILERAQGCRHILSYASFSDEIGTWSLNRALASEGRLLLPLIVGEELHPYRVDDLKAQLERFRLGFLQPIPDLCQRFSYDQVDLVLAPGLGFDENNHRIGYGKGFYDRLLSKFPPTTPTIGLAFYEQLTDFPIPNTPQDVALTEVFFC